MTIRRLDKSDWATYFDDVSRTLGGKNVTLEAAPFGKAEMEAKAITLGGLVYDAKSDVFEVQTETLDHLIQGPKDIYVDESPGGITSIEVIDRDGVKQIIILSEPVAPGA